MGGYNLATHYREFRLFSCSCIGKRRRPHHRVPSLVSDELPAHTPRHSLGSRCQFLFVTHGFAVVVAHGTTPVYV